MSYRIALVARKLPPLHGGGGMLARTLAIALASRGHKVDILTDTPSPAPVNECRVLSPYRKHQPTHVLFRLFRRLTEYIWLSKRIRSEKYDIIYGISAQAFTLSAVHAAKMAGLPVAFETSLYGSDDYLTVCQQRLGFILRHFFLSADRIVNISPPLEKACIAGGISKQQLALIPNPINENDFFPTTEEQRADLRERLGLPKEAAVLFSAGAVSIRKGYDRLIDAFIHIAHKHADTLLVLAGPVNDDPESAAFYKALKHKLRESGYSDRVHWLDRVENVGEWMRASDIFIFGSRREGFGTVFTEAMSTGLPIVTYSLPGITDYIFNQVRGAYIVNSCDEFVSVISMLVQSSNLRQESSKSLRERYMTAFSANKILEMYESLFKSIEKR